VASAAEVAAVEQATVSAVVASVEEQAIVSVEAASAAEQVTARGAQAGEALVEPDIVQAASAGVVLVVATLEAAVLVVASAAALVVAVLVVASVAAALVAEDSALAALAVERDAAQGVWTAAVSGKELQDVARAVWAVVAWAPKDLETIVFRLPTAASLTASSACHPIRECTISAPQGLVPATLASEAMRASAVGGLDSAPAASVVRPAVLAPCRVRESAASVDPPAESVLCQVPAPAESADPPVALAPCRVRESAA